MCHKSIKVRTKTDELTLFLVSITRTRLISIVSKPIKVFVVVVVIVVVVIKNEVQKLHDPKTIHVEKTLGLKVFDQNKFG